MMGVSIKNLLKKKKQSCKADKKFVDFLQNMLSDDSSNDNKLEKFNLFLLNIVRERCV
jgi:hypothetical protein